MKYQPKAEIKLDQIFGAYIVTGVIDEYNFKCECINCGTKYEKSRHALQTTKSQKTKTCKACFAKERIGRKNKKKLLESTYVPSMGLRFIAGQPL